jgi:hypothetical protein
MRSAACANSRLSRSHYSRRADRRRCQPGTDCKLEHGHLGPFFDIFGDELGELVGEFGSTATTPRLAKPLLDIRIEHRRVGLFVERRDGV